MIRELKILQVSSASEIGGGETHLLTLLKGLSDHGHSLLLALRPNSPLTKRLSNRQIQTYTIPLRNSLDIFSARQLARIIQNQNIDIIHCHYARDYLVGAMAVRFAPRAKLILTRHVPFRMKKNIGYRKALTAAERMICVSESVRQEMITSRLFDSEKLITIYNGIDIGRFDSIKPADRSGLSMLRSKLGLPDDSETTLIGVIGQLAEHKGQAYFIEAAASIARKTTGTKFIVTGRDHSKDQEYKNRLRNRVVELGISDRVTFVDYVDDLPSLIAALDILVLPSLEESFGLILVEAMAGGTSVIATNIGGPREIIEDGKNGLLVQPQNSDEISAAVMKLISNLELRDNLASAAKTNVAERFPAEKMVVATETVYLEALQN